MRTALIGVMTAIMLTACAQRIEGPAITSSAGIKHAQAVLRTKTVLAPYSGNCLATRAWWRTFCDPDRIGNCRQVASSLALDLAIADVEMNGVPGCKVNEADLVDVLIDPERHLSTEVRVRGLGYYTDGTIVLRRSRDDNDALRVSDSALEPASKRMLFESCGGRFLCPVVVLGRLTRNGEMSAEAVEIDRH